MQASGAEKKEKDFTTMNKRHTNILLFMLLCLLALPACKSEMPESPIPVVFVYEEINLNDIRLQNLQQPNGYIYLDDAGYRGIIVHSDGGGNYRAFDRACPYHPQDPCAQVSMHDSGFYMEDDCCGSTFDLSGNPTGGPARNVLRRYSTFIDNNYLIISSN